jgi:chromosome segregation ATPase
MRPTALEFASRVCDVTEHDFQELNGTMKHSSVTVELTPSIEDLRSAFLATHDELSSSYAIHQEAKSHSDALVDAILKIKRERLALVSEHCGCLHTIFELECALPIARTTMERLSREIARADAEHDAWMADLEACATTCEELIQQPHSGALTDEEGHLTVAGKFAEAMEEASKVECEISILAEEISRKVRAREALEEEVPAMKAEIPRIRERLLVLEAEIRGREEAAQRLEVELENHEVTRRRLKAELDEVVARSLDLHVKYLDAVAPLPQADPDAISRLWSQRRGSEEAAGRNCETA